MTPLNKMLAAFGLGSLLICALAATFLWRTNERVAVEQWREGVSALAFAVGRSVEGELEGAKNTLAALASLPEFADLPHVADIDRSINGIPERLDQEKRRLMDAVMKQAGTFSVMFVLRPNGDHYISHPFSVQRSLRKYNLSDRVYFREAKRTGETVISDSFVGADGAPAVAILVPIDSKAGERRAYLGGVFHLATLSELVSKPSLPRGAEALIADRNANIIAHTDKDWIKGNERVSLTAHPFFKESRIENRGVYADPETGERMIGGFFQFQFGWGFGLFQPLDAALGQARRNLSLDVAILILTIATVSALGLYVAWKLGWRWERADALALESVRKYHSFVETSGEGFWLIDPVTKETQEVNDSLLRILGYSRDEMLGKTPLDFADADNKRIFVEQTAKIADTDHRGYEITLTHKAGHGVETRFSATTLRDADGAPVAAFAFVRDITNRKRAERALAASESHLRSLIQASPYCIHEIDANGNLQSMNQAGLDMVSAKDESEIRGLHYVDYVADEDNDRVAILLDRAIHRGEESHFEFRSDLGGRTHVFASMFAPLGDAPPHRILGVTQDITERARAERALADKTAELERSNAELQEFAHVVSHDLQEPLRVVTGFMSLLSKEYEGRLDADADEYIRFAVEGAERMSAMIRDLLQYSRVQSRAQEPVPVAAGAAVEEAVANLQASIEEAGATLAVQDALPTVMADESQLVRLFQNLVGNAVKYRDPARPPEIAVAAESRGEEYVFSVRDNGIGIDEKNTDRIFGVFQRLHLREEYDGTGIGLAVVKRIVERHGGRIWVESTPGEGSAFFFTLPDRGMSKL